MLLQALDRCTHQGQIRFDQSLNSSPRVEPCGSKRHPRSIANPLRLAPLEGRQRARGARFGCLRFHSSTMRLLVLAAPTASSRGTLLSQLMHLLLSNSSSNRVHHLLENQKMHHRALLRHSAAPPALRPPPRMTVSPTTAYG